MMLFVRVAPTDLSLDIECLDLETDGLEFCEGSIEERVFEWQSMQAWGTHAPLTVFGNFRERRIVTANLNL